jgi:hypothetical protein
VTGLLLNDVTTSVREYHRLLVDGHGHRHTPIETSGRIIHHRWLVITLTEHWPTLFVVLLAGMLAEPRKLVEVGSAESRTEV